MTQPKHAAPTPNAPCNIDHGVKKGDNTIMVSLNLEGSIFGNTRYYNRPIPADEVEHFLNDDIDISIRSSSARWQSYRIPRSTIDDVYGDSMR